MKLLQTIAFHIGTLAYTAMLVLVGYGIISAWHIQ